MSCKQLYHEATCHRRFVSCTAVHECSRTQVKVTHLCNYPLRLYFVCVNRMPTRVSLVCASLQPTYLVFAVS